MVEHHGCAARSRERGEPLLGTASTVNRWVLIEQPGAWGHDALLESDIPVDVALHLRSAARRLHARPVLVRRPGVHAPDQRRTRTAFLVTTPPDAPRVRRLAFTDPRDLLAPLAAAAEQGIDAVGEQGPQHLVLVCTHGRHDTCCAVEGRPVAAALATARRDVWECSHIGGDRFAANVVVLPVGTYHGRVRLADVAAFALGVESGQLDLDHFRGRTEHPFAVQAAEVLLRRQLVANGLADVRVLDHADAGADRVRVRMQTPKGPWEVVVAREQAPEAHLLTCRSQRATRAPRYRLVTAQPATT